MRQNYVNMTKLKKLDDNNIKHQCCHEWWILDKYEYWTIFVFSKITNMNTNLIESLKNYLSIICGKYSNNWTGLVCYSLELHGLDWYGLVWFVTTSIKSFCQSLIMIQLVLAVLKKIQNCFCLILNDIQPKGSLKVS